jgi:FMN phosphatase YigB (HAD superfamily)
VIQPDRVEVVVCDAFGTLVQRWMPSDAYRRLWALRDPAVQDTPERAMRSGQSFRDLANTWGVAWSQAAGLEDQLRSDVLGVMPYPEAREALTRVRATGRRLVVCSNLALPYAEPIMRQFRGLVKDWIWSFETGALKPEAAMFEAVMKATGRPAAAHFMVGDRLHEDVQGPQALGWQAVQVVRPGQPGERSPEAWSDLSPLGQWAARSA